MLKSMLVGLDASPHSQAAVELGIRWAKRFDALLAGIGVVNEPALRAPQSTPIGAGAVKQQSDDARLAQAQQQVERLLSQFALRCTSEHVSHKLLEDVGAPTDLLLREAQRFDLLLLGRQGRDLPDAESLSSDVLETVLRHTPRPIVAVPETLRTGSGVLVAYDGSVQAARALQLLLATGIHALGEIRIIAIDPKSSVEAAKRADRAAEFLAAHQISAKLHPVVSSQPAGKVLVEEANHLGSELLVMGAYGKNRLRDFFIGSVTKTVLQDAQTPVLLYH